MAAAPQLRALGDDQSAPAGAGGTVALFYRFGNPRKRLRLRVASAGLKP